jgi:hypothetical protein
MPQHRTSRDLDTRGLPTARVRDLTDAPVRLALERGLPPDNETILRSLLLQRAELRDQCAADPLGGPLEVLGQLETELAGTLVTLGIDPEGIVLTEGRGFHDFHALCRKFAEVRR